jgi:hypothetical protein
MTLRIKVGQYGLVYEYDNIAQTDVEPGSVFEKAEQGVMVNVKDAIRREINRLTDGFRDVEEHAEGVISPELMKTMMSRVDVPPDQR